MANLRDIKRRITTVKSTQKITSAMKMVAAAKLRRAQDAIGNARPYATRMRATLEEVSKTTLDETHPLLAVHPGGQRRRGRIGRRHRPRRGRLPARRSRRAFRHHPSSSTQSISTAAPRGSEATPIVVRAG